jgi:uncharacterized protein (TIGR02996 family)
MILEHPDDDGPRLVYADWLEEHGDTARAEFIRVQIEKTRLEHRTPEWMELHRRDVALAAKHCGNWLAEFPKAIRTDLHFKRGFVEMFLGTPTQLIAGVATVFRRAPLREIHLTTSNGPLNVLLARPEMARVRSLAITSSSGVVVDHLAESLHLTGLERLELNTRGIGAAQARRLTASAHLHGLKVLVFRGPALDPAVAEMMRGHFGDRVRLG